MGLVDDYWQKRKDEKTPVSEGSCGSKKLDINKNKHTNKNVNGIKSVQKKTDKPSADQATSTSNKRKSSSDKHKSSSKKQRNSEVRPISASKKTEEKKKDLAKRTNKRKNDDDESDSDFEKENINTGKRMANRVNCPGVSPKSFSSLTKKNYSSQSSSQAENSTIHKSSQKSSQNQIKIRVTKASQNQIKTGAKKSSQNQIKTGVKKPKERLPDIEDDIFWSEDDSEKKEKVDNGYDDDSEASEESAELDDIDEFDGSDFGDNDGADRVDNDGADRGETGDNDHDNDINVRKKKKRKEKQKKFVTCKSCEGCKKRKGCLQRSGNRTEKMFKCKKCSRLFASPWNLKRHNNEISNCVKSHSRQNKKQTHFLTVLKCSCGKQKTTMAGFVKHNDHKHEGTFTFKAMYQCLDCRAVIGSRSGIYYHIRKLHPKMEQTDQDKTAGKRTAEEITAGEKTAEEKTPGEKTAEEITPGEKTAEEITAGEKPAD